jgi:superfamily II RNA helicase
MIRRSEIHNMNCSKGKGRRGECYNRNISNGKKKGVTSKQRIAESERQERLTDIIRTDKKGKIRYDKTLSMKC